jgi:hypothetical protein
MKTFLLREGGSGTLDSSAARVLHHVIPTTQNEEEIARALWDEACAPRSSVFL